MVRPFKLELFWTFETSTLTWAGRRSIPEIVNSRFVVFVFKSLIICPNFPTLLKIYHWECLTHFIPPFFAFLPLLFFWATISSHPLSFASVMHFSFPVPLWACALSLTCFAFPPTLLLFVYAFLEHEWCWVRWRCRFFLVASFRLNP